MFIDKLPLMCQRIFLLLVRLDHFILVLMKNEGTTINVSTFMSMNLSHSIADKLAILAGCIKLKR